MANGKLGAVACIANATNVIYTAPSGINSACVNLNIVNMSTSAVNVNVAITSSATPTTADWIEYGATLAANGGVLERTGLVMSPGEKIVVITPAANQVARVYGYEDV